MGRNSASSLESVRRVGIELAPGCTG